MKITDRMQEEQLVTHFFAETSTILIAAREQTVSADKPFQKTKLARLSYMAKHIMLNDIITAQSHR